jgi:uncharacterized membrane protein HdeD (DUF308 family)
MLQFMEETMKMMTKNWWVLVVRGVLAIIFGILIVAWPIAGVFTLVILFGAFAFADGITSLIFASRHKESRAWLIFGGIIGIAAGIVVFVWPAISAVVLLYVIAAWAFLIGIAQMVFAFTAPTRAGNRVLLGLGGVFSIIFGIFLMARPAQGALAVLWIIGFFLVMFGVYHIVFGFYLKDLKNKIQAKEESK